MSPVVVLRRERKWLAMIGGWEKYMDKNYKKVSLPPLHPPPPSQRLEIVRTAFSVG